MLRCTRTLTVAAVLLLMNAGHARAADWPGWRGPTTDMVARDADAFEPGEDAAFAVAWQVPLGPGYASVSVAHGLAVTAFSDGVDDVLIAFNADTGDEMWRHSIDPTYVGHDGSQTGPISTPYVTEDLVYALGPKGRLVAVETATGDEVWTRHLVTDHGVDAPFYGFATSPLVSDDVLLLQIGAGVGKAVVGFDRHTGEPLWHAGDGGVQYQSPSLARIGGETRLVFATNEHVGGIRPSTGELLWTAAHGGDGGAEGSGSANPLAVASDKLFLTHRGSESALLDLAATDGHVTPAKVWESRSIRSTYGVPVHHDGYLYSYSGSILTCVDVATGDPMWKSRPPGPGFPMVVNGRLVIATQKGGLHLALATPAGYTELAWLELSDELIWAAPSFADGAIFVRSLGEAARVEVVAKATPADAVAAGVSDSGFRRFLREARDTDDAQAVVDSFMAAQDEFPVIEGDGTVWFVYRGAAGQDVAIAGDFLGNRRAEPMLRLEGTDVYYYGATVDPESRLNYRFVVDFDTDVLDPLNPRSVPITMRLYDDSGGASSWFAMPAWRPASHLADDAQRPHGRVDTMDIPTNDGGVRTVHVYVPAGYDDSPERHPVAYVHWGAPAQRQGQMTRSLDNLIGDTVRPVIVVYIHRKGGGFNELLWGGRAGYVQAVAEEVVPAIEERYRTEAGRGSRASVGYGFGGLNALDVAFSCPDLFGKVAVQSPMRETFHENEVLAHVTTAEASPFVVWLGWGKYGTRSTLEGWSLVAWNVALREFFEGRGYAVRGGQVNQGPGWESWRQRNDEVFETLFPMR